MLSTSTLSHAHSTATSRLFTKRPTHRRRHGAISSASSTPSVQLGTAKIPKGVDEVVFADSLYQWAATLTVSGQNLPFALPQKVDRTDSGFTIAFLTQSKATNAFESIGEIVATIEGGEGMRVLMVRGYGKVTTGALVDVPVVMQTMPGAIKQAAMMAAKEA